MKKLFNKWNILALILIFTLSTLTLVTYSFYVDDESIENKMKLGYSSGEIDEEFDGDEKKVYVENTGTTPLLVRANATMVCYNGDIILDATKIANAEYNTEDWTYGDDGWYYYNEMLPAGEKTKLLVHVTTDTQNIPADEKALYDDAQLDVPVLMEYYFPLKNGETYTHEEAWNISDASETVKLMLRNLVDNKG